METLKIYTIFIDGIDKTGKDLIAKYIWRLDKRLNVFCRGWPSLVVYAKKFHRDCLYTNPYNDALYVHLTVEYEDWRIRCELTNEPPINYIDDAIQFKSVFNTLKDAGYNTMQFNTSIMTPYQIAKEIVEYIKKLNNL